MATGANIRRAIRGTCSPRSADAVIADLATRQHGRSRRGLTSSGQSGRTRPMLALARRATASRCRRLRRPAIETHRIVLPDDEVTVEAGIPVTTPARTLFDLAAVVREHHLDAAFQEAEVRRLTSPTSLDALVARYPTRRGTPTIKRILEDARLTTGITKSELEKAFLAFLDAKGLPRPHRNYLVLGKERDCVWPEHRLVAELDSWGAHGTRRSFESDRLNDRETILAGWRPLRITYRHIVRDGNRLERDLREATTLAARPAADLLA